MEQSLVIFKVVDGPFLPTFKVHAFDRRTFHNRVMRRLLTDIANDKVVWPNPNLINNVLRRPLFRKVFWSPCLPPKCRDQLPNARRSTRWNSWKADQKSFYFRLHTAGRMRTVVNVRVNESAEAARLELEARVCRKNIIGSCKDPGRTLKGYRFYLFLVLGYSSFAALLCRWMTTGYLM